MASGSPVWSPLTDQQLFELQVLMQLACGRSHGALSKRRQQWFCWLGRVLKAEADLRGLPSPTAPFHAAQVSPPPLSL